jgi:hypothetical protein
MKIFQRRGDASFHAALIELAHSKSIRKLPMGIKTKDIEVRFQNSSIIDE